MGILVGKDTRLVVSGITGREGSSHAQQMLEYGTPLAAGVTPAWAGALVITLTILALSIAARLLFRKETAR